MLILVAAHATDLCSHPFRVRNKHRHQVSATRSKSAMYLGRRARPTGHARIDLPFIQDIRRDFIRDCMRDVIMFFLVLFFIVIVFSVFLLKLEHFDKF